MDLGIGLFTATVCRCVCDFEMRFVIERSKPRGLRLATCVTNSLGSSCLSLFLRDFAPSLSPSSSRPSADAQRDLATSFETEFFTELSARGSDRERFCRRSTMGGPGDLGRPSAHRSMLLDFSLSLLLKSDFMERRREQERARLDFSGSTELSRSIRSRRSSSRLL